MDGQDLQIEMTLSPLTATKDPVSDPNVATSVTITNIGQSTTPVFFVPCWHNHQSTGQGFSANDNDTTIGRLVDGSGNNTFQLSPGDSIVLFGNATVTTAWPQGNYDTNVFVRDVATNSQISSGQLANSITVTAPPAPQINIVSISVI